MIKYLNDKKRLTILIISIVIFILFFCKWISIDAFFFQVEAGPTDMFSLIKEWDIADSVPAATYLLYLIPISSMIVVIAFFVFDKKKFYKIALISYIAALLVMMGLIFYINNELGQYSSIIDLIIDEIITLKLPVYLLPILSIAGIVLLFMVMPTDDLKDMGKSILLGTDKFKRQGNYKIKIISGDMRGLDVELTKEPLVFGRDPKIVNIILKNKTVSRKHCSIYIDNYSGDITIEDFSSVGTWVNRNVKLNRLVRYVLHENDTVYLGDMSQAVKVIKC